MINKTRIDHDCLNFIYLCTHTKFAIIIYLSHQQYPKSIDMQWWFPWKMIYVKCNFLQKTGQTPCIQKRHYVSFCALTSYGWINIRFEVRSYYINACKYYNLLKIILLYAQIISYSNCYSNIMSYDWRILIAAYVLMPSLKWNVSLINLNKNVVIMHKKMPLGNTLECT